MPELMQRVTSGFEVTLSYFPSSGEVVLRGETEQYAASVVVAPESASNAFEHPCCYLPTPERFFERRYVETTEEEETDGYGLKASDEGNTLEYDGDGDAA
jgi:hypothetical protein